MKRNIYSYPAIFGVGFVSDTNRVLSFVDNKGAINITSTKLKKNYFLNIVFLRGITFFLFGIVNFFYFLSISMRYADAHSKPLMLEEKISNNLKINKSAVTMTIIGVFSFILGFVAFCIIPGLIGGLLPHYFSFFLRNLFVGLSKVILFYVFLLSLKIIPSIQNFYKYNASLNKCINCMEKCQDCNIKNMNNVSHHRLTNFLTFIVFVFMLDFFMVSLLNFGLNIGFDFLINLATLIFLISLSYEFLRLIDRQKLLICNIFTLIFSFLVTSKPEYTENETAAIGFGEIMLMLNDQQRKTMDTLCEQKVALSAIRAEVKNALTLNNIDDESESDWLIATILGKKRAEMKTIPNISIRDANKIRDVVKRRINHEPLSSIFGFVEFYGLNISVDNNVLTPRIETEILVEECIKLINKNNLKTVLDIGTGSGAIAISIAKNTNVRVVATDISKAALKLAIKNAKNNQVIINFIYSDIFENLKRNKKFDIIISNPPYLETNELKFVSEEVKNFDPIIALDGGDDGLYFYRRLISQASAYLNDNGVLALEISYTKAKEIKKLLSEKFTNIRVKKDYFGNDRVIIAFKKE